MTKGNVLFVLKTNARHCYEAFMYHLGGQEANGRLNSAESEIDMTQRDRGTQYERV